MEESVDMDTDIPHQVNDPIEIEEEEEPTEGAPTSKSKGSKLLERVLKGQSVGNNLSKSKRMAKEWPISASIVTKYTRPSLLKMGQKI